MTNDSAQQALEEFAGLRTYTPQILTRIILIALSKKFELQDSDIRTVIKAISLLFKSCCENDGYSARQIRAIMTKFRDAGRRSAPWKPTSSRVPGRPQDGSDGNRINRWLLPEDHKFYANELNATLVELKYYLQALSMTGAPSHGIPELQNCFTPWLIQHDVIPGNYLDPVQLIPIDFKYFIEDPRRIQSGHFVPLDRGGKHHPENTFLMLSRSNQLQGNLTLSELLDLMCAICNRHQMFNKNDAK